MVGFFVDAVLERQGGFFGGVNTKTIGFVFSKYECFLPARKIADFRTSNVRKSIENEPQASRLIS